MSSNQNIRVVITGVGLTAPNANNLKEFRDALLAQKSGITQMEVRYMGKVAVGNCNFDENLYQKKKMRRRGTRAGSISIYCAHEALLDSGLSLDSLVKNRTGISAVSFFFFNSRITSHPSIFGIITSSTIKSGRTRAFSIAAFPSDAEMTSFPSFSRLYFKSRTMSASSSTTRIFLGIIFLK